MRVGVTLSMVGPDVLENRVGIGVPSSEPPAEKLLRERYGDMLSFRVVGTVVPRSASRTLNLTVR